MLDLLYCFEVFASELDPAVQFAQSDEFVSRLQREEMVVHFVFALADLKATLGFVP